MRLHQFPEAGTALVLGTGSPPSQPDAYRVRYGLQMRSGAAPLASRYLTVTEPYCVAPVLDSVERLAAGGFGGGEALRITRGDVTDLLMLASDAGQTVEAAGARLVGRAALARSEGDTPSEIRAYAFSSVEAPGVTVTAAPYITGEVVTCDYAAASIVVSGIPVDQSLVGRPIRIHNELRSTLHIIATIAADGDRARLTLTTSALRHEGWVSAVSNGSIRNGAPSPWAFDTFFTGTRLVSEDASSDWIVTGAAGGWWSAPTGTRMSLRELGGNSPSAESLTESFGDADGDGTRGFRVYEYGSGDLVEVASFAALRRGADGQWTGVLSPGARVATE